MDLLETVARALARRWLERQIKQPDDVEAAIGRIWRSHKGDGRAVIGAMFEDQFTVFPEDEDGPTDEEHYLIGKAQVDAALEDR